MDRPAPIEKSEIEVTPEMIEAGADELRASLGGGLLIDWNPLDLASSVYRAMDVERRAHS